MPAPLHPPDSGSGSGVSPPYAGEIANGPVERDLGDGSTVGTRAGLDDNVVAGSVAPTTVIETTAPDTVTALPGDAPVEADEAWSRPAGSTRRPLEQWSVIALVAAGIGLLPFTWPVPILSLMGVAFGLVGMRNCQLDRVWRNRWMAVLAFGLGMAILIATLLLTSLGKLHFLPFWTTSPN